MVLHHGGPGPVAGDLELGGISETPRGDLHSRHQLRDQVDQARHQLGGRYGRHPAGDGSGRPGSSICHGVQRWRLHHERSPQRDGERAGIRRLPVRRQAAGPRARRAGPTGGAPPLFLEECQMGSGSPLHGTRPARLLGVARLSHPWRPLEGRALQRRLMEQPVLQWQAGTVTAIRPETLKTKSFTLALPKWMAHRPGQHYDIRLTAPDGYQTQRSYSIASAPRRVGELELTVERIADGEVSPYLHDVLVLGDRLEVRGPVRGDFGWEVALGGPLLVIAGGSGVVPLMAMLRHRAAQHATMPTRMLYSSRTADGVIYRDE